MKRFLQKTSFFGLVSLAIFFLMTRDTYAYLDPGTGSYFFQIILAVFLGSLFSMKMAGKKIKYLILRLFAKRKLSKKSKNDL